MPNKLIKDPVIGGGGSGSGSGSGSGDVGGGGAVPTTPGTPCFESFSDQVVQMWPPYAYSHTYIEAENYFLVTSLDGQYAYHAFGVCYGGYVQVSYTIERTPVIFGLI